MARAMEESKRAEEEKKGKEKAMARAMEESKRAEEEKKGKEKAMAENLALLEQIRLLQEAPRR